MNDRPQSLGLRFAANGLNIFVADVLRSAGAESRCREQLDQVGSFGFRLADKFTELIGRLGGVVVDLPDGRKYPRTGQRTLIDAIAQINVDGRADALHRRESAAQSDPRVFGAIQSRAFGILAQAV